MPHAGMADLLLALDAPAHQAGPSWVQNLVPLVALLAIFYFLLYRPQAQKQKEHEAMVQALKKDDRVVTQGGLHGRVAEVGDGTVVLDVGGKARLTFDKSAISKKLDAGNAAEAAK
jgi:preprotein translocase subunit YajC